MSKKYIFSACCAIFLSASLLVCGNGDDLKEQSGSFLFMKVGAGSPLFSDVRQAFREVVEPIYGSQWKMLSQIEDGVESATAHAK